MEQPSNVVTDERRERRERWRKVVGTVEAWQRRLRAARRLRAEEEQKVWRPLYERVCGRLANHSDDPEMANALHEYRSVLRPHIVGTTRECRVRLNRLRPGEDAAAKLAQARQLGEQALALAEAIGFVSVRTPRSVWARCVDNSLWSMGVLLFGFSAPAPAKVSEGQETEDGEADELRLGDPTYARGGHDEMADAGMPWVRSIDPREFLADPTHRDFYKSEWCAIEESVTRAEAAGLWPEFRGRLRATHTSLPVWDGDDAAPQEGDGGAKLIRVTRVYLRQPRLVLTIPHEQAGVAEFLEVEEAELGMEGLPIEVLGLDWVEKRLYPIPPLARGYDPAVAEGEHLVTLRAAAGKMKVGTIVNEAEDPGLAAQLATGEDNGVYRSKSKMPLRDVVQALEVGGVRREHIELAGLNRESVQRSTAMADMQLGVREPGDQRVAEIRERQAATSVRLAGLVGPARTVEASAYRRLMAIAYAKLDLLHGLALPVGDGADLRWAVFDATQPAIGELLDYEFGVSVADKLTTADEVGQLMQAVQLLPGLAPQLQAEGVGVRMRPLLEELLQRSETPRADEVFFDLPPPEPAPPAAGMEAGGAVPPEAQPPAEVAGASETEQVGAALAELPDGDPREEPLLARLAELQAQEV
jgi:hypothetical protein